MAGKRHLSDRLLRSLAPAKLGERYSYATASCQALAYA